MSLRIPAFLIAIAATATAAPLKTKILIGSSVPGEPEPPRELRSFEAPFGLAFDEEGYGFVVELGGARVWKLDFARGWRSIRIAGKYQVKEYTGDGGSALLATFNGMHNCAVAADGDLLISDTWNHCVRRIDRDTANVSTFAGTGVAGFAGDRGPAEMARFHDVISISLDPKKEFLYVADIKNRRIRSIDMATRTVRTVAGNGKRGIPKNGALATESPLVDPRAVIADDDGRLWILERGGHALRTVSPKGVIETVAGTGVKGFKDGPALMAQLAGPKHLCLDGQGRIIIADEQNAAIRAYDPVAKTLTTILGRGVGLPPRTLSRPHGVTFHEGKLYIVDSGHDRILVEAE